MDEFGVLVQSIGFKGHGKSAPMAKLKAKPDSHVRGSSGVEVASFNHSTSLPVDELDGIFRSNVSVHKSKQPKSFFVDDCAFFGEPMSGSDQYGGVDLDFVLNSSNNGNSNSRKSAGSDVYDDLLGSISMPKLNDPLDDLIGNLGVNSNGKSQQNVTGFDDDLLAGFGGVNSSAKGEHSKTNLSYELHGHAPKSSLTVDDDPFLVFESSTSKSDSSWGFTDPLKRDKETVQSSFEELDKFSMGPLYNDSCTAEIKTTAKRTSAVPISNAFENIDVLDEIFSGTVKQNHIAKSASINQDSLFDSFFQEEEVGQVKRTSAWSSSSSSRKSSTANMEGNFNALFGDVIASSGEFHEIEGEPIERRRARLNRHVRMNERMAQALNDKNQRDFQSQLEQEEKHRLAETVENDIRHWAAGKEGNLRALLSSLQQVLWPECGWHPVSLTDLITSNSVKKVYKKASLCVHPDKVQQRGASVRQKYIAEKVFDILKEAWNKFNAEELR